MIFAKVADSVITNYSSNTHCITSFNILSIECKCFYQNIPEITSLSSYIKSLKPNPSSQVIVAIISFLSSSRVWCNEIT